jgi:hypothetical protein
MSMRDSSVFATEAAAICFRMPAWDLAVHHILPSYYNSALDIERLIDELKRNATS